VSGRFLALGDAISEALAAWNAAELEEPADVEECPRAMSAWSQELAYTYFRTAERLAVTGIHTDIPEAIYEAGSSALEISGDLEHLASFRMVARYP
jgi:hypothetical protein